MRSAASPATFRRVEGSAESAPPTYTHARARARAHTHTLCVCVCVRVCVCVCVCVWNIGEALTYLSNIPCTLAQPITKSVVEGMLLAASDLGDLHSCTCTAGVESYLKCKVQRYYCTHDPTFPTSPAQINAEPPIRSHPIQDNAALSALLD